MIKYTTVNKPKSAEIFSSLRTTGTPTMLEPTSPVSLQFIFTAHPIVQAGQHPDMGHSTAEVQEQDPRLSWQFCLRSPTSSITDSHPLHICSCLLDEDLCPSGCVQHQAQSSPSPSSALASRHCYDTANTLLHTTIISSCPFSGVCFFNLPSKYISLTGHHHYYYYLLFRLQL